MTPFPIDAVRARFPALAQTDDGRPRIYLDNPAGTQVPETVAAAVSDCLLRTNANLGGSFTTSRAAERIVDGAHAAMADFLGAGDPGEIIVGPSMTTLTYHLSRGICRDFVPGDEIVVTQMDHEGDISPWLDIARDKGLTVRHLPFDETSWQLEPDRLAAILNHRTRLVALNHASNLTGSINDIAALVAVAKAAGALTYIDAVQFSPHGITDVHALGCDFLACSSYKFFGPHLGIVWGRRALLEDMAAYKCRCADDALPTRHETGTPQIELLAGLGATVDYFDWLGAETGGGQTRRERIVSGMSAAQAHELPLTRRLIEGLSALDGLEIYGIVNPNRLGQRVPTISFRHRTIPPEKIAASLAAQGIFVWNGHNYAYAVVKQLGIPEDEGVVRIGIAHYNTEDEIARTVDAVAAAIGQGKEPTR